MSAAGAPLGLKSKSCNRCHHPRYKHGANGCLDNAGTINEPRACNCPREYKG